MGVSKGKNYIVMKLSRFGYGKKCQEKGCGNIATVCHHLDSDRSNNDPLNLRYICKSCHQRAHAWDKEDSAITRSHDGVDDIQAQRTGFRLTAGFNMLYSNAHNDYD
jgi:hypothetical protein